MTPNGALFKTLSDILVALLLIDVLLFVGAGRLNWMLGWLFVAVWGLLKVAFILLLRWHDPALLVERETRHENTQLYDRWLVPVYFGFSFGTILVAFVIIPGTEREDYANMKYHLIGGAKGLII